VGYSLHFGAIWASFDKLLSGLAIGLGLAVGAVLIGTLIGLLAAFASVGPSRVGRLIAGSYVTLIRNLPLLVLVLLVYFALPQAGFRH
jgi:His/Glu/Gln/Arg/opine family amino acid ABC transporter permease subunit